MDEKKFDNKLINQSCFYDFMKKIKGFTSTFLIIILFLSMYNFLLPIESVKADTLHVGSGQTYSSIQSAINIANESDTIYVHSGTYSETIIINKSLTLTGEGGSTTTISGSGDHTIKITSNNVIISGFKIKNTMESYYCIFLDSVSNCEISNNHIKNGGHGTYLKSSNKE